MRLFTFVFFILTIFPSALYSQKKSDQSNVRKLFGKYSKFQVTETSLKGTSFYLVSGHGGPDPGAIGKYNGKELHEDEYAYDIVLRLARELMSRGAKVQVIIQDEKDGIRDDYVLENSKTETCMGDPIPLSQIDRLSQRCMAIDKIYKTDWSRYKRGIFVHVDSRGEGEQTDVFFYNAPGSKKGKSLADNLQSTFNKKYGKHQPNRGFTGTVGERDLYVLVNSQPISAFLELGNISNPKDQKRLVIPQNRQALAVWIADGIEKDYKEYKH